MSFCLKKSVCRAAFRAIVVSVFAQLAGVAQAQSWPAKPILIISSASIASSGDAALRMVSAKMSSVLGQPVTVEFRGGAGGVLAAQAVMRAPADGHTLLFGSTGSYVFAKYLMKNLPFDITKDFAPVSMTFSAGCFLAVHPSVPVNSFQEFIDYSKKNPGKLSYATTGVGTIFHLLGESLKIHTGVDMVHIPYTQANYPQLLNDWSGGRVEIFLPAYSSLRPHLSKMKVLAVFDRARDRHLPNVPQINELVPAFDNVLTWWGYFAPAGLPRPIAERIAAEIKRGATEPDVAQKLEELAMNMVAGTPDDLARALRADLDNTARIVKRLGIEPQ